MTTTLKLATLAFMALLGCGVAVLTPDSGSPGEKDGGKRDAASDSTFACGAGFTCSGPPCTPMVCERASAYCQVTFNAPPTLASMNAETAVCRGATCDGAVTCACVLSGMFGTEMQMPCTQDGGVVVRALEH
jgi:hypothetical protein